MSDHTYSILYFLDASWHNQCFPIPAESVLSPLSSTYSIITTNDKLGQVEGMTNSWVLIKWWVQHTMQVLDKLIDDEGWDHIRPKKWCKVYCTRHPKHRVNLGRTLSIKYKSFKFYFDFAFVLAHRSDWSLGWAYFHDVLEHSRWLLSTGLSVLK